jgi:hypothetical protein
MKKIFISLLFLFSVFVSTSLVASANTLLHQLTQATMQRRNFRQPIWMVIPLSLTAIITALLSLI